MTGIAAKVILLAIMFGAELGFRRYGHPANRIFQIGLGRTIAIALRARPGMRMSMMRVMIAWRRCAVRRVIL
ncbi:hypothetical protein [Cupriavidus pauculus]|uniref:hypothetical protein n=1 Tax=Cupriavidus pauculus TaxID=82633 RepID=UPI001CBFC11D|nr:hypothetical protein [Cupriavidus pauculus]